MSGSAARSREPLSRLEQLRLARQMLRTEGQAVLQLAARLGDSFCEAVDVVCRCEGTIIVTGMGKAGLIGQKIAATLASTGTRAHFLHPGDAVHGDLGRIHPHDTLLALSHSGNTEELVRLLPALREMGIPLVAITGNPDSALARYATVTIPLGSLREACTLGLAPSTSTTAMLALGDALALVVSRMRGFSPEDFARFHPGGALGRKLAKVEEVMRPLGQCRLARQTQSLRQVLITARHPGRRTGAIMITDQDGQLVGIFTDSDLARLLERKRDEAIDGPLEQIMTRTPKTISAGSLMLDALQVLAASKISELPVLDAAGRPVGLIDITDTMSPLPPESVELSPVAEEASCMTIPFPHSPETHRS